MKWKKPMNVCIALAIVIVMFSGSYYLSYRKAMKELNNDFVRQDPYLTEYLDKIAPFTEDGSFQQSVHVDTMSDEHVTADTSYRLEVYDINSNQTTIETVATPAKFIGKNRAQIIQMLSDEMKCMPLEEHQKGLVSYVLVSFSPEEIVLRKTYNADVVQYKYYVALQNGIVIVYYSDKKTVFDYTGIEAATLSDKNQSELSLGKYVKDDDELYALLEGYTS